MSVIKTKNNLSKLLLGGLAVLLIIGGIVYGIFYYNKPPADGVNYSPPTEQEKQSGNEQKERNIEREKIDNAPKNDGSVKTISLTVTDAAQYGDTVEVRAFSRDVYENGGRCTITFTRGASTVTSQSNAFADASTTQCGALDTARSKFPETGTWSYNLTYTSASSQGNATGKVEIQ